MTLSSWLGSKKKSRSASKLVNGKRRPRAFGRKLLYEQLEDRVVLSAVRASLFTANTLAGNDDGSTGSVAIGFSSAINFFGPTYTNLFVNNNGNVTFGAADGTFTPAALTSAGQLPRIAPFFADVDTTPGLPDNDVKYGTGVVGGRAAFGVNWPGVGYYSSHTDKLNKFQLVLIERFDTGPGNFDIELNYDQIRWETGDASGGSGGLGGTSAAAGFTNGSGTAGTNYQLSGSLSAGAFLDTGPAGTRLIGNSLNSGVLGRYTFFARAGVIVPTNQPPTAQANGPYTVAEGSSISLSSAGSTDADGTITTYQWDFNYNGITFDVDATGASPTFNASTLDGPASRTIGLRVTDDDGATAIDTASLTISNVPPSLTVTSASVTVFEGQTAANSGTYSDPSPGDNVVVTSSIGAVTKTGVNFGTWNWSFLTNDGPAQGQGVTVFVNDGDGGTASAPFTLIVNNRAPTATLSNGGPVNEGSTGSVSFSGQFDPSSVDTTAGFHYAYDFDNNGTFEVGNGTYAGSGTASSATVPASFLADGPGTRTVRGRIIDKDGGFTDYTTTITINNVAPVFGNVSVISPINENDSTTVSGTFYDPGTADTHTIVIDWNAGGNVGGPGEGTTTITTAGPNPAGTTLTNNGGGNWSFTASHQYLDDNPTGTLSDVYEISVTVTDDNGGSDSTGGSQFVMTFNTPPNTPPSYTEVGMTVAVVDAGDHLHLADHNGDGSGDVYSHNGPSQPYKFQLSAGGTFTLVSFDVVIAGTAMFTSSSGAVVSPVGLGTVILPAAGWSNISSVVWDTPTAMAIDNFVFQIGAGLTVTVNNKPPVANAGADQTVNEGTPVTLNGSFTDVGSNDGHKQQWSVVATNSQIVAPLTINPTAAGDSNGAGGSSFSFTPNDNGTYTVTYTVTDDDGGTHTDTATITVNNVVPTLSNVSVTSPIDENDFATLSGDISDPGTPDTFTLTVNWGEGAPQVYNLPAGTTTFSVSHQYLDDNPTATPSDVYIISGTFVDDDGGSVNLGGPVGNVIVNGSFETANYSGWTLLEIPVAAINNGTWGIAANGQTINPGQSTFDFHDGINVTQTSPGLPHTYTATDGTFVAYQLQNGSQFHRMYQDVAIPLGATTLSWSMEYRNHYNQFDPNSQNLAVNIRNLSDTILQTLFVTAGADPQTIPMTAFSANIAAYAGTTVRLSVDQNVQLFYFDSAFDNFVISGAPSLQVTVNNRDPVANAGANQTVDEGDLVTLNGSFSDVGVNDGHKQEWSVVASNGQVVTGLTIDNLAGDSNGAGGSSFSFTANDNGTYTVSYKVTDDDGGTHTDTATIIVDNVDPTLSNLSATPIFEDGTTTLSGTIADVGTQDTFTVEIDWNNDGSYEESHLGVSAGNFSYTHQYLDDNPTNTPFDNMPINVKVTDDDTGFATGSTTVQVTNLDPTLSGLSATPIFENGTTTLSGTIADVGTLDTFTVEIDWDNDGSYDETHLNVGAGIFNYTHQYLDDNPTGTPVDNMPINVKVTDDDTGFATGSTTVEVTNVAPVITSLSNSSPECGDAAEAEVITISGMFTDVGTLDTHTVMINWGDTTSSAGTVSESGGSGSFAGSHVYAVGGIYTITVTLTDDDTGTHTLTTTTVITGVGVVGSTLYVIGTDDDDHVTINQTGSDYKVHADFLTTGSFRDVPVAGVTNIVVQVCDGDDQVTISNGIGLPALIDGGNDNDKLNGGSGPNIIIGGAGDDNINGGSARDVLLGGTGADRIVGNSADDLLIAGTTSYDADYDALNAVMAEWGSARSYAQRLYNLSNGTSGGTLDGSTFGSRSNGGYFLVGDDGANQTVFNDNDQDKLTGSAGVDWFFANLVADNGGVLDIVTDKASVEVWTDSDL